MEPHVYRDQGLTSTQVNHQPASDEKENIAVCRLLKVQLSCSEEFAESAGPYRDQGVIHVNNAVLLQDKEEMLSFSSF